MKYLQTRAPVSPDLASILRRRRGRRGRYGAQYRRDILTDLRDFHPYWGGMPAHAAELAEEVGARLTVLAVRTHVAAWGRPAPPVTLRMRHALRMLARWGGGLTVARLADAIGIGSPAASQLSDRMRRRGLVTKEAEGRDRRERTVRITPQGWRYVPRDEPARKRSPWGSVWDDDMRVRPDLGWPDGVRRFRQPPSEIDDALCGAGVDGHGLLAGLRSVQATILRFNYPGWEADFECAVAARRRVRRDRRGERYVLGSLPRPRYGPPVARGRPWRPILRDGDCECC